MQRRRRWLAALMATGALLSARAAYAGDVELGLEAGPATYATTWRGDFGAGGTLRAGARFSHVVALDFQTWESYAAVNHRANTGLSIGVTGYVPLETARPFARLFAIHQHEEALVSVENAPAGTLFGIGSGIRHRAGGGLCLGIEVPVRAEPEKRVSWLMSGELSGSYFPDATLGPAAYVGIDLRIGVDFLIK